MRYELKNIGYWGFIKISFFVNFLGGLVIGFFYGLLFSLISAASQAFAPYQNEFGDAFSSGAMIIVLPIFFAFAGSFFNTILGLIFVFIYNMGAKFLGGLEMDFEPVKAAEPPPQPYQQHYHQYAPPPPPQYQTPPPPPPPRPETPPPPPAPDTPQDQGTENSGNNNDDEPKKDQGYEY